MAIEKLSQQIAQSAQEEAAKITSDAELRAAEILKAAKSAAAQKRKAAEEEAKGLVATQRAERIAAAKLEAKKMLAQAEEEAVESSLGAIWSELKQFRRSKEYSGLLSFLATAGLDELSDKDGIVFVNSEDAKHLSDIKNLSKKPIECSGGCMVESRNGKVRVDMTLETLFESSKEEMRKKVHDSLFR